MKIFTIENDCLSVQVSDFGAELHSIFNKKNNTEHLWQADKNFWGWHAPVLFPVVGRCWEDEIAIDQKKYAMEKHGFTRKSTFDMIGKTEDSISFELSDNEATAAIYPFQFSFQIHYVLKENELTTTYKVVNKSDQSLYFSLGAHPAFAVPFFANEKYEDYFISFEKDTSLDRHFINDEGFFTGETKNVMHGTNELPLFSTMFNNDAYIFKELQSRKVVLQSKNHENKVEVSFPDFNYLGLWAKVNAPYVCIEPWLGCADTENVAPTFDQKEGILQVEKNNFFETTLCIGIF